VIPINIVAKRSSTARTRAWQLASACLCVALASVLVARADTAAPAGDEPTERVRVATVDYHVPDIRLVRDDGRTVSLPDELDDGRAVLLNFVFTSCTSVCPLSSKVFEDFVRELGPERGRVHLVSISIDPEQDTPARLRDYARQFHAGPEWRHYTGTTVASLAAQRAFGAFRGSKMQHTPLTLLRAAPGKPWVRIDGYVTAGELMHYYRDLLAQR
jgi:protein SCO1/2